MHQGPTLMNQARGLMEAWSTLIRYDFARFVTISLDSPGFDGRINAKAQSLKAAEFQSLCALASWRLCVTAGNPGSTIQRLFKLSKNTTDRESRFFILHSAFCI